MTPAGAPPWTVLLLGGSSATGKTRAAELVAARFGVPWLQLDDIRLALQQATTPEHHSDLHYFRSDASVWERPEEQLVEGLKAVGRITSAAAEAVVAHHLSQNQPVVIEGDGILPRMAAGTHFAGRESAGSVRAIFLVEPREEEVLAAFQARGPRGDPVDEPTLRTQARVSWLFGQWLQQEALTLGLAVVAARPYERVAARLEKELR
jgi:2-phosphoglycerate kinase